MSARPRRGREPSRPNGVELPSSGSSPSCTLDAVSRDTLASVRASIEADNPVVLAGLRRILALVDISEAPTKGDADLILRGAEARPDLLDGPGGLDITCSSSSVAVTVRQRPTPEVWSRVLVLLEHLVPAESGTEVSVRPHD